MHGLQRQKLVLGCERGPFAALALVCAVLIIGFHTRNSIAAAVVFFALGLVYLWLSARRPSPPPRRDKKRRRASKFDDVGDAYAIRDDYMRPVATPSLHVYDPAADLYPPTPY